jgi:hypothetical protein
LGQTFSHFAQIYGSTLDGVLNNNGLTSSGVIIVLPNGSTGANNSIDPLPILQQLVSKYNAIITRNNPPKLMNDVATSPFLSHILTIVNNGIMKGYSTPRSARFAPDKAIDRGEFITVV